MPLFTPPTPTKKQVEIWHHHVNSWEDHERWHGLEYSLSNPRVLWRVYWERFNMIQVPILPRDEFFEIAIGIAKIAKNKDDFKKIFNEKNKERLVELEAFLSEGESRSARDMKHFPCHDAFAQTIKACGDPYFLNLMRLLKGNAFGWEADVELHEEPINKPIMDPNEEYYDPNLETQHLDYWDEEYEGGMEPEEYIPDENYTLPKATSKKSPSSAQGKRRRVRFDDDDMGIDEQQHQELDTPASDLASQDPPPASQVANQKSITPEGVDERRQKRRRLDESPAPVSSPRPSTEAKKSVKRSRRDESDNSSRKRQRRESPTLEATTAHSCSPEQAAKSKVSKKRSRHDDEDDHSPKRQKLETFTVELSTSDTPISPQSTDEQRKISKKRSRQDDSSNVSHKHQKLDGSTASDTSSHHTADQPTANGTAADESASQNEVRQRGSQRRKATATKTSRARPPPSRSPNKRSSRRNGSATLWELDDSGKAKLR